MTPAEFKAGREALGLKRSELARLFETTPRSVRNWEKDTIPFAVAALMRLAVKYPMVRRELGIKSREAKA